MVSIIKPSHAAIVDPAERTITVLALSDGAYTIASQHRPSETATSMTLGRFSVEVQAVMAAAEHL